jgi:hypothetical protein
LTAAVRQCLGLEEEDGATMLRGRQGRGRCQQCDSDNGLRKRMAASCSEARVDAAARSEAGVEAVACYEAGVEEAPCSEAGNEAAMSSRPGIKNSRRWRHDGV